MNTNFSKKDVHTEHCCIIHGCKYCDNGCTVTLGILRQSYTCEECNSDMEDRVQAAFTERRNQLPIVTQLEARIRELEGIIANMSTDSA